MTKYDAEVLLAAVNAFQADYDKRATWRHIDRNIAGLRAAFDSLERAPWWREVADPDEVIPEGCPVRIEGAVRMTEGTLTEPRRRREFEKRVFIDTRWTPPEPPKPFAIGDVIETVEQAARLPLKAGFTDKNDDLWQMRKFGGDVVPKLVGGRRDEWETLLGFYQPLTIVYLPEESE